MPVSSPLTSVCEPERDCALCPRLAAFRESWRVEEPDWFNAPVPSFGTQTARFLVVGLAPGLRGANRTGRPFTGDGAGDVLYPALARHGFLSGRYDARPDDGIALQDARITNAVRCVPPENKPTPAEIRQCAPFLGATLSSMGRLKAILALGKIAHDAVVRAYGERLAAYPFGHASQHAIAPGVTLFDSFHTSRYNMNTGRLTTAMFDAVLASVRSHLENGKA
ncbi:MAG: uracil-DNA glycosylase [Hyphomicrobiaceae bacterium]|nr:uracil-DNA glycosylase [Hyphomicrobiaceae bacterium]